MTVPNVEMFARKNGEPTDEEMRMINKHARTPMMKDHVYVHDMKMIGDGMVPQRYMKLHDSLIKAFTKQANDGNVAYMLNHAWATWGPMRGLPTFGRVFRSWTAPSSEVEGETMAQYASAYIVRSDVEKQGTTANALIEDIDKGILFDVSIGFVFEMPECSICGNDIRDMSKCPHYPGQMYDGKLAYVIAKPPGEEFEVSSVFAGAYPTARALSATAADETKQETEMLEIEAIKSVAPGTRMMAAFGSREASLWVPKGSVRKAQSFSISGENGGDDKKMADELNKAPENPDEGKQEPTPMEKLAEVMQGMSVTPESVTELLSALNKVANDRAVTIADVVAGLDKPVETANSALASVVVVVEGVTVKDEDATKVLGKTYSADKLLSFAKAGLAQHENAIKEVLEWRVRAQGNEFDAEAYANSLREGGLDAASLRDLAEGFAARAGQALKSGRVTAPQAKTGNSQGFKIPADAYKA